MPWPSDDPETYFANRGWSLAVRRDREHGDYSADLTFDETGGLERRYGCGASEREAGVNAVHRWHVEQDPDPPLPRRLP
jgi:hypothetical protein